MKKLLFSLIALCFIMTGFAQNVAKASKKSFIGISINAVDFSTGAKVQAGTIGSVLNNRKWGQFDDATKTIGVQYSSNLNNQIDVVSNLDLSITRTPFNPNTTVRSDEGIYASIESGINYKMFEKESFINPYVAVGLGIRSYALRNFTAYLPVGVGLQIKACKESFFRLSTGYNAKMSNKAEPAFTYGLSYSFPL